ncbi:MAG: chorismate-binding protein, partial [Ferruginibacter sp.]
MAYYKQYFEGAEVEKFKLSMLNWADRFSIFCFLDSHHYEPDTSGYAWLLAAGAHRKIKVPEEQAFSFLKDSYAHANGWWFGHIGFGLQESFFPGQASPDEYISFGQSVFFEPLYILSCQDERLCIESLEDDCENIFQQISSFSIPFPPKKNVPVQTEAGMTKSEYLAAVKAIRQHIIRGDCYELNFCQEFTASGYEAEPLNIFNNLSRLSPNPFAALYKLGDKYCICESPERYLKKEGDKISSSPIKGTSRRYPEDEKKDEESRRALLSSAKDKSENVMVVDLVRNDLSKVCREGTVQVEELFKLKSFPAIHHLVSTVSGNLV